MAIYVKESGVWRTIEQPYAKTSGTWRTIAAQSVKDSGTWKTVFPDVGGLWTFGFGAYGQLGTNDKIDRSTPVTTFAGGTNWKQVYASVYHNAAIKIDGTLWTFGFNSSSVLGINDTIDRSTPVTTFAGGTNWKEVSSGVYHNAAIKTDGTLWVWGGNGNGQLGTNDLITRSTPVTTFAGGTNWKQVSCGIFNSAAIKTDGTLWVWGSNVSFQNLGTNDTIDRSIPVTTFAGGTNWKQISCGYTHTSAIKTDGTLWVWGNNGYGQLGTNNLINRSIPVTTFAGGTNWKQVDLGAAHSAAIKTDGTLWVWGLNTIGQLGTNDNIFRSTPVTTFAGGTNWKQVSAYDNTLAIKTDGTLWVWGYNAVGQLGTNNISIFAYSTPATTFAGGTNWKQVSAGGLQTAAIRS